MPTIAFSCRKCPRKTEVFLWNPDETSAFPICCGKPMKREIGGGAAVLFKGSGFSSTDYRTERYVSEKGMNDAMAKTEPIRQRAKYDHDLKKKRSR